MPVRAKISSEQSAALKMLKGSAKLLLVAVR